MEDLLILKFLLVRVVCGRDFSVCGKFIKFVCCCFLCQLIVMQGLIVVGAVLV